MYTTIRRYFSRFLLGFLLILTLFPFYLLVINSFKSQTEIIKNPFKWAVNWQFTNYAKALPQVIRPMLNSFWVTLLVILITVAVSMLASYAFVRYKSFRGRNILYYGIIALLMIPGFVMLIPQFIQITRLKLYDTFAGLIFPPAAYQVAMGTFLIRSSMESISKSLFEAAYIEGAGDMQILIKIVLPLSTPILSTVTIMTGLNVWNNYIWPLVASSGTATQQIAVALTKLVVSVSDGNGVLFAGYIIASLPLIILFCFASKYFVAGLTQGAVKG